MNAVHYSYEKRKKKKSPVAIPKLQSTKEEDNDNTDNSLLSSTVSKHDLSFPVYITFCIKLQFQ